MSTKKLSKKVTCLTLLAGLIISCLPLQTIKASNTEDLKIRFKRVDEYVESQRKQYHIPGLSIGIVKGDKTVYSKGFGNADSKGRAVTPQTPFLIGSVSKSFTALAIVQLIDEGKINLDTNVDKYLPWFKANYEGKAQKITIQQLLNHTSGMGYFYDWATETNVSIEELVKSNLNNSNLIALPGTRSDYSNANYIILGEVIQSVTGKSYQEYIKTRIFEPLEMKHSYVSKTEAIKDNLATGHQKWFGYPIEADLPYLVYSLPMGQIISCAEDMTHYVSALMNGGIYKNISIASKEGIESIFKAEAQEEFFSSGIEADKCYYGFGWRIYSLNNKINMIQHTGETADFHCNVVMKPEEKIGVIELANLGGEITPISIGIGTADIMIGKTPKASTFIGRIYLVMKVVVILIAILLLVSVIRLRSWKSRLIKSKRTLIFNMIFMGIMNFILPLCLLINYPHIVGADVLGHNMLWYEWRTCLIIAPDFAWSVLITLLALILVGIAKIILLAQLKIKANNKSQVSN